MLRGIVVALFLSSVAAEIPLAEDSLNLRQTSESSVETQWPWSIKDSDLNVKFIQNTGRRTVETLTNTGEGAGYMGEIKIGGQPLTAIWDTGSDQQVVNSARTMNLVRPCALSPGHCYNNQKSSTYRRLSIVPRKVSYGSGDTFVLLGSENIATKAGEVEDMPFYELLTTNIPNILTHEIDVVAGLGPRGWKGVTLIKEMKVDRFSFCFPADNKKDGYLIWNDDVPPEHFNEMKVPGETPTYWSVPAHDFALTSEQGAVPLDFKGECIVDSGTSLITLDKETLAQVERHLNTFEGQKGFECTDETLNKYPDLVFNLAGKPHRFRPHDYMMYTETQEVPETIRPFLNPFLMQKEVANSTKKCVMMFTPPMEKGTCILGMPFMRNYYTTFDRTTGTVHTALHDGECNMGVKKGLQLRQKVDQPMKLRRIDVSKLQFSSGFMSLWNKNEQALKEALGFKDEGLQLREKL
jgi:hypothetical protein